MKKIIGTALMLLTLYALVMFTVFGVMEIVDVSSSVQIGCEDLGDYKDEKN